MSFRELKKFRIERLGDEVEAKGEIDEGRSCLIRLAKTGKNKFRTIIRDGDEEACRETIARVKREMSR